jgi:hypothetical protein
MKGDHSGGWKKLPRPLKRKLMEQIAALAAHYGSAAVDGAVLRAAEAIEQGEPWITREAASAIIRKHAATPPSRDYCKCGCGCWTPAESPAQEAAPRGGREDCPTCSVVSRTGGRFYCLAHGAPPAAQASHENALEGIAQAAAALDVLDRKPLAAWLMRIHADMAQASDTGRGEAVPEAVRLDAPPLVSGIARVGDWIIAFPSGCTHVVDERYAKGWNTCREYVAAHTPTEDSAAGKDAERQA